VLLLLLPQRPPLLQSRLPNQPRRRSPSSRGAASCGACGAARGGGRRLGTGGRGRRSPVGDRGLAARGLAGWGRAAESLRARAAVEVRASGSSRAGAGRDRYIFFSQKNEPGRLTRLDPVLAPPMCTSTTSIVCKDVAMCSCEKL
jgi:hypothetical protein